MRKTLSLNLKLARRKVLFVKHCGCNVSYLTSCLRYLSARKLIELKIVRLENYLSFNQNFYDILIYQVHPGQRDKPSFRFKPFRTSLIIDLDNKFFEFKKFKVLFDAHSSGDGYSRLNDKLIPRIKNAPHENFLKEYDVICCTTHPIKVLPEKQVVKDIDISFCAKLEHHLIRQEIKSILEQYAGTKSKDLEHNKYRDEYREHLRHVWISVCAPGYGAGSFRHLQTLNAKSLMFAHASINKIKLLPNAELIDGEDYISFDLDNMTDKLDFLLKNKDYAQKISENGFRKFMEGYSFKKTALTLFKNLSER